MEILLVVAAGTALVAAPVGLAWILARYLPRFCGYVLGPAALVSWLVAVIYCHMAGLIFVDLNQRTDAWGPWQVVIVGIWLGLAVWFLVGVVLVMKGLAGAGRLAADAEHEESAAQRHRFERDR